MVKYDFKKLRDVSVIEFVSWFAFVLIFIMISSFFMQFLPTDVISKDQWPSASTEKLQQTHDQLSTYIINLGLFVTLIILASYFLYNVSRKLIWEKLVNKKYGLAGFWKYSLFNTIITISVFVIFGIAYYLVNIFFKIISYLISFLPEAYKLILTMIIPLVIFYYMGMIILFYLNKQYFKFNGNIKKVWKSFKKIRPTKYVKSVVLALVALWLGNFIIYLILPPTSIILSIIVILMFSIHLAYLKIQVSILD